MNPDCTRYKHNPWRRANALAICGPTSKVIFGVKGRVLSTLTPTHTNPHTCIFKLWKILTQTPHPSDPDLTVIVTHLCHPFPQREDVLGPQMQHTETFHVRTVSHLTPWRLRRWELSRGATLRRPPWQVASGSSPWLPSRAGPCHYPLPYLQAMHDRAWFLLLIYI